MRSVFRTSLRSRLMVLGALILLPGFALTLFENVADRNEAETQARDRALELAHQASHGHVRLVETTRNLLRSLASVCQVRGDDAVVCQEFLRGTLDSQDQVDVGVMTIDGVPWASEAVPDDRVVHVGHELLREVLATGEVTEGRFESGGKDGRAALVYACPVRDQSGGIKRVLYAILSLAHFVKEAIDDGLPASGSVVVMDSTGQILYWHPATKSRDARTSDARPLVRAALADQGGTACVAGLDGVERLYGFCPVASLGRMSGVVAVGIPFEAAFGVAQRALIRDVIILVAVALCMGLGGWLVGEHLIFRRLDLVFRAASRLRIGDLGARVGLEGQDEIARLAQVFDAMADRLQGMVTQAEKRREDLSIQVRRLVDQRTHEITSLNRMSQILHACHSPDEVCRVVGEFLGETFPGDRGTFIILDPGRNTVQHRVIFGEHPNDQVERSFSAEECWALRRGQNHLVKDTAKGLVCRHLGTPAPRSTLCVPIMTQGEVLGILHLASGTTDEGGDLHWGATRERFATTVAEQCALALANLRLQETLREQSMRDPLTGLLNRRFLDQALAGERWRGWRKSEAVGLAMLDIDHFKQFNDTYGHEVGDAVLVAVARKLARSVRGDDLVCRVGGEEFVMVLPGLSLERTLRRAQEICRKISELKVRHRGEVFGPITLSAGVAACPEHGGDALDVLRAADAALYEAKLAGRNRAVAACTPADRRPVTAPPAAVMKSEQAAESRD